MRSPAALMTCRIFFSCQPGTTRTSPSAQALFGRYSAPNERRWVRMPSRVSKRPCRSRDRRRRAARRRRGTVITETEIARAAARATGAADKLSRSREGPHRVTCAIENVDVQVPIQRYPADLAEQCWSDPILRADRDLLPSKLNQRRKWRIIARASTSFGDILRCGRSRDAEQKLHDRETHLSPLPARCVLNSAFSVLHVALRGSAAPRDKVFRSSELARISPAGAGPSTSSSAQSSAGCGSGSTS